MAVVPEAEEPVRDRLLRATYEMLLADGYVATTVAAVARRAGLTTGAIYSNFVNKHEMLVRAVLWHWSRSDPSLPLHLAPRRGAAEGSSPLEDLARTLAHHVVAPPRPEHRLLTEVTGAAIRDRDAASVLRSGAEHIMAGAAGAIEQAKADGQVDETISTDALTAVVVALYLGSITAKSFELPLPDQRDVLDLLITLMTTPRARQAEVGCSPAGARPQSE